MQHNDTVQKEKIELSSRGYELDQEKFIFDICIKYNCTSRTAKEYIQTAKRMQEQDLE